MLPGLMKEAAIFRATVHARFPTKSAQAFNRSTQVKRTSDKITLLIDDVQDMLRWRY